MNLKPPPGNWVFLVGFLVTAISVSIFIALLAKCQVIRHYLASYRHTRLREVDNVSQCEPSGVCVCVCASFLMYTSFRLLLWLSSLQQMENTHVKISQSFFEGGYVWIVMLLSCSCSKNYELLKIWWCRIMMTVESASKKSVYSPFVWKKKHLHCDSFN